jgi:hypothetical protein
VSGQSSASEDNLTKKVCEIIPLNHSIGQTKVRQLFFNFLKSFAALLRFLFNEEAHNVKPAYLVCKNSQCRCNMYHSQLAHGQYFTAPSNGIRQAA